MAHERARRFLSRHEAETARPRLDPDAAIPLQQFADLIGDYTFPKAEWVRCQLVGQKGKCRRLHGWGWIAQLSDGTEGYIGHDCVTLHVQTDKRFAQRFAAASARVDREITADILVLRLQTHLDDPNLPSALEAARRRERHLSDRTTRLRAMLPHRILKQLERVHGNDLPVPVRVLYVETIEDEHTKRKRDVVRPQEYRWGTLTGLEGLRLQVTLKIGARLAAASAALSAAVASLDQAEPAMRKWAAALEYTPRADEDLRRQEAIVESFCRPENLKLLWLLTRQRVDQIAVAAVALEIASRKQVTEAEATSAIDAWTREIKEAHGGRQFEIAL
jgi:hypothetical protein